MSALARVFAGHRPNPVVAERVRTMVAYCGRGGPGLDDAADLVSDHGLDSLDRWQLLTMIEDHFDITVADDDWIKVRTTGDAINLVEKVL